MSGSTIDLKDTKYFNVIDWRSCDLKRKSNIYNEDTKKYVYKKEYLIRAFGRDRKGKSHCWSIYGFQPYFYIKINDYERKDEDIESDLLDFYKSKIYETFRLEGDEEDDRYFTYLEYDEIEQILEEEIIKLVNCKKKNFFYFQNNKKFNFVKIYFKTKRAMNVLKQLIAKNDRGITMYECNIDPLLRFFHTNHIEPSGWIYSDKTIVPYRNSSRCDIEYEVNYVDIESIEVPLIAPFIISSFDIEAVSKSGNFPQGYKLEDKIIQIGITTHRQGENVPYENCLINLGECDDIEGCDVIRCEDELDLLKKFENYINKLGPDILIGYNTFGFDWKFIKEKYDLHGSKPKMSKIIYENARYVEKKLSSSALGDNLLRFYEMSGIVQIDLFKSVNADFNLESYKLDDVSSNFLRGKVSNIDKNIIQTNNTEGIFINNQISLIDNFGDKINDGMKFNVIDKTDKTITLDKDITLDIEEHEEEVKEEWKNQGNEIENLKIAYQWCENKINMPVNILFKNYFSGKPDLIAEIGKYCVKDCVLCNTLLIKLDIITKNIGMSNVCCVPFSFLFGRGQGIKILSVVAKQCQEEDFLIPINNDIEFSSYEGAIVLEPVSGIHLEPVAVMDYSSLYPSSMISENISHDSLVKVEVYEDGELINEKGSGKDDPSLLTLEDYNYKTICYSKDNVETKCIFVEHKSREKNVIPRVLQKLLKARKDTKKKMKKFDKSDFMYAILDGLQLAYKLVCNSLYGQVGASTSAICMKELAASTTATGRELILMARDMILDKYEGSECIYGDTDSVFIKFNTKDLKEAIALGEEAGDMVTEYLQSQNRQPHVLEYEKTFFPYILITKKRYTGYKYEFDDVSYVLNNMGIVTKRRDNPRIVKDIFNGVISIILKDKDIEKAQKYYCNSLRRVLRGEIKLNRLITSKSLKASYKKPQQIAHNVLANRIGFRDPGNKPEPNDRLHYIFISDDSLRCSYDDKCKCKINTKKGKCIGCLNIYCEKHIDSHECKLRCYQCVELIKCRSKNRIKYQCPTCKGYFCKNCMKHECKTELQPKLLTGDKIETPEYIMEKDYIKPHFRHYVDTQIRKPVEQIFELDTESYPRLQKEIEQILTEDNLKRDKQTSIMNFFSKK